jgi:hypothetical protein
MEYKMAIHTAPGKAGHFIVELSNGESTIYRGFTPVDDREMAASLNVSVPGYVSNDEDEAKAAGTLRSQDIPLNREQYDKAKDYIDKAAANPGNYDLTSRNCVDFANGALKAAGIDKNVGQVMTPEQDKQMSGAALYRNAKYPDPDRPLTFPEDGMYPGGTDPHAGVDRRSDATDSVGGLANEAAETQKAVEWVNNEEQTANLDSRIQSMRDFAAQPIDQPAQSALLKPVDTWTESEMKDVLNSAQGDFTGTNAGDPLKAHLYEKVQDWHTTNYGEGEQQYEGGKPVEPLPIRAIPEEPAPYLAKDGGDLWQASARMGDKLTGIAQTDGYEPSVKALQDGLNMLNDANPPTERSPVWGDYTPQDRLKVDGDYGPKTDFALKSALAGHGEDKVDGALNLGRFKGFAEEAKGGDASGLGTMTTSLFGDDSGEALQRTLNRVGPDTVEGWQPLEEDNQIGPMTTNAFTSVMDSFDPGEFTQGFGEEMGLL